MAGKEYDPTSKEGRGNEGRKGLPSGNDASKEEISRQDARGNALMAETALKKRVSKKEKQKPKETPQASPSQIQEQVKPKSIFLEAIFQRTIFSAENQILRIENEQLRTENEELAQKEEYRKEQQRKRAAKWRESHPETHKERERERYRNSKDENQ